MILGLPTIIFQMRRNWKQKANIAKRLFFWTKQLRKANNKDDFRKLLKEKNIGVIFRENKDNRIYGVTFTDYSNRAVLNGSLLGKEFSANVFQSTQRRSFNESYVQDAGICHGSAGIAMIYRRMYLETGLNEFKETTMYWIQQILNFATFKNGLAGYKTLIKDGWICDYTLLMGISSIGLVLLSYIEDNQQSWDELFLLS